LNLKLKYSQMDIKKNLFLFCTLMVAMNFVIGQEIAVPGENIRLNQLGFYPEAQKIAIVVQPEGDKFYIVKANQGDTVFKGKLQKKTTWEYSEELVSKADFSKFTTPGAYQLCVGKTKSYTFNIAPNIHLQALKAGIKSYYFQRVSMELDPKFAGKWARKAGHPDTSVLIHNSAVSAGRPAGAKISSPKGWYDAGDYNKYIVNSGISTYTLMALYEDFPALCDSLSLNIPESSNQIPDLLDEVLWNLRWMLTMQDPADGGVYHKLTNANFDAFVMPAAAKTPRYVVAKSTPATLDFAAVMAQASRIFAKFQKQVPGLSDSCLKAAVYAFNWSRKNDGIPYKQDELKNPKVNTGTYDDFNFADEFQWAGTELFITTGKQEYYNESKIESLLKSSASIPSWNNVGTLALFTLSQFKNKLSKNVSINTISIDEVIVDKATELRDHLLQSPYGVTIGQNPGDFNWGSNSNAANQGMILIKAYLINKDKSFLDAALADLDYLLGRNAVGFSFLTGYGTKSTMHPHHRPSDADGVTEPIPGLLAGGPNSGQQDKTSCGNIPYPSNIPAKSYLDNTCSYASNEVAINWNAPFVYLAGSIEAIKKIR
jgi:endoglucanase